MTKRRCNQKKVEVPINLLSALENLCNAVHQFPGEYYPEAGDLFSELFALLRANASPRHCLRPTQHMKGCHCKLLLEAKQAYKAPEPPQKSFYAVQVNGRRHCMTVTRDGKISTELTQEPGGVA